MALRFRSLQEKLTLYAFLLCVTSTGAAGILTYIVAKRQVQQDRVELMMVIARQLSQEISRELNNASDDVHTWAQSDLVRQAVTNPDRSNARTLLQDLIYQKKLYDMILVIDKAGQIRSCGGTEQNLAGQHYSEILTGVPPDWYTAVLQGDKLKGIPRIQLDGLNKLLARGETAPVQDRHYVVLAAPISGRDEIHSAGVVVSVFNWSRIKRILDSAETQFNKIGLHTGYAFMHASDALTCMAHKYPEMIGKDLIKDHDLPELSERMKRNPSGTMRYKWREGWKTVALEQINIQSLGEKFTWYLGVGINETDIFSPVSNLLRWFLLVSACVALTMVLVTHFVGRKISVSLREFAQLARDAAHGRFSQLVKVHTDDEIGELGQAFDEMLVSFRTQLPFKQVPNPYVAGNPLRSAQMFFGRFDELQWIGRHLVHDGNKIILLAGPRRIGKTSLLHQIAARQEELKILPFFLDTQQILPEVAQDADFYHILTREVLSQLPSVAPGIRAPFISTERFTPETLRRLLKFLCEAEPGKTPVFLFDELENLEYKFSHNVLSPDLLFFLAALLDGESPISFVATGSDQFESLKSPHWKVLIPKSLLRRIGLLTHQDALRLILEPMHGYAVYDDGVPEAILRLTAGHPYYTQVICQTLVDHLNRKRHFAAGEKDLSEVVEEVLNNAPPPLHHVWDSFTAPQKAAASTLAHVLAGDGKTVSLTLEMILDAMPPELRLQIPDVHLLRAALNQLTHDDWVEFKGTFYQFRIDLLRLWLQREHSIWRVADELQQGIAP